MAKWLILRERTRQEATGMPPDRPPAEEPESEPIPTLEISRLEMVAIVDANADQPQAAGEQAAQQPGCRYVAVRWDTADVFDADPRPVTLTRKGNAK